MQKSVHLVSDYWMVLSSIRKINLQLFVTNLHVLSLTDFAVKPELKAGSFNTSFNDQMTVFFFFGMQRLIEQTCLLSN